MGIYNTFDYGDGTLYGDSAKVGYSAAPFSATAIGTTVYSQNTVIDKESNGTPVYGTTQVVRPKVFLTWSNPTGAIFGFRVVRNQDGWSETEEDGEIILETFTPVVPDDSYVYDELSNTPLVEGRYAYYTIWILLADFNWAVAAYTYCLIPTRHNMYSPDGTVYKSSDRRFLELLPKVYTSAQQSYVDEVSETSDLRTFLGGFSYTLDEMLTFADLLIPDISGRYTNPNTVDVQAHQLGLTKEPTLSLQRKKALIRNALTINKQRGSIVGLESFVESITGFAPQVNLTSNLLLSIQDSSFYKSVGNWKIATNGTLTANLTTGASDLPVQTEEYSVDRSWTGKAITTSTNVVMSLGKDDPRLNGVPVTEGTEYLWTFYHKVTGTGYSTTPTITWYDSTGTSLSTSAGTAFTPTTTWTKKSITATAPTNAYFAAIELSFSAASTYYIDMVSFSVNPTVGTPSYSEARGIQVYLAPTKVNRLLNPSTVTTGSNLMYNPSLETNIDSWYTRNGSVAVSSADSYAGDSCGLFTVGSSGTTAGIITTGVGSLNYLAPVTAGLTYTFSMYVKDVNTSKAYKAYMDFYDAGGTNIGGTLTGSFSINANTTSWQRVSVTGAAPATAAYARTYVYSTGSFLVGDAGKQVKFDGALFEQASSASTYFDKVNDSTAPGISLDNSKMLTLHPNAAESYSFSTQTDVGVPLGRYYTFSVYGSATTATEYAQLTLQAYADGTALEEEDLGVIKSTSEVFTLTDSWSRYTTSLFVPEGYVDVYLVASIKSPEATIPTQSPIIAAGNVTLTTSAPHGFTAGQTVSVSGLTPSGYNTASATIVSVDSPTTFTYTNATTGAITVAGTATQLANGSQITLDAAQLEEGYGASDYFDGSYTSRGAYWTGTANNSVSVLYRNITPKLNRLIQELPNYLPINTAFTIVSGYNDTYVLEYSGFSS